MYVAILIILIVVGGIVLWGALTGWTFSGIFGGAETDSPPGPISNVQVGVATGESGGRRESYTTPEEMEGLSITVSFNTPKRSFGYGDLALKDYVISLGITGNNSRGDLLAVIVIPRNDATGGTRLITSTKDITAPGGIALSGDFNARDSRVSVTLSSPVWRDGGIIIPEGGVFLGIDYTPMKMDEDYAWLGDQNFNTPAGDYTKYFIPGGVTLIGAVEDDAGFVPNTDVTNSINERLDIAMEEATKEEVGGDVVIGKQVGKSSRFLISPSHRQDIFFGFPSMNGKGIKAAILGEPGADCILNTCRAKPSAWTDNITGKIELGYPGVPANEFWGPESNWFNFAIMERHPTGWVRLGLISNFEKSGDSGEAIKIKRAQFPVLHPVTHFKNSNSSALSFHKSSANFDPTYVKFVSPLDSSDSQNGKKFSLCVRNVGTTSLSEPLSGEDLFLVYTWTASVKKLKEIDDLSMTVFTKRNPDSGPVDLDCDSAVSVYDNPIQEDGGKSLTFKNSCDTSDIVGAELGFGLSSCQPAETIKFLCDSTPGCIGFRTHASSDCSGLLMDEAPVCKRYSEQVYGDTSGTLDASSGKIVGGGNDTFYLNGLCLGDPDATYEKWGDNPLYPVGGGCNSDINVHKTACSANPQCVGFHLQSNNCSHLLRRKGDPTISDKQTDSNEYHGNYYLDRHDVSCDSGALNKFVLKKDSNNKIYYDYKCVEGIPGFSLGDEQETGRVNRTSISTRLLTDPNIGVDCGGSPISRFRLGNVTVENSDGTDSGNRVLLYRYNCANKQVETSTCTDKESTGISNIVDNEVSCDGKGVITQFQLAKKDDADGGKYYYKYRCCDL